MLLISGRSKNGNISKRGIFRYFLLAFFSIPLLPFMYLDGRRIRSKVPKLPEAKEPEGVVEKPNTHFLKLLILGESTVAGVGVDAGHEERVIADDESADAVGRSRIPCGGVVFCFAGGDQREADGFDHMHEDAP